MSARPGRIMAIFENRTPRPRAFSALATPELAKLSDQIRGSLDLASAA
jgi:hypothetical protein